MRKNAGGGAENGKKAAEKERLFLQKENAHLYAKRPEQIRVLFF